MHIGLTFCFCFIVTIEHVCVCTSLFLVSLISLSPPFLSFSRALNYGKADRMRPYKTFSPLITSFAQVSRSSLFYASTTHSRCMMTHCAQVSEKDGSKDKTDAEWRAQLTEQQYQVLRRKATDRRGVGEYDDFYEDGNYVCAGCGTLLYTSAMKFRCGCGWPGFWDCVPKAVREERDADGSRTEILCNACNGHLGHVFRGEGFTNPPPNERHCVNSTSINFVPISKS